MAALFGKSNGKFSMWRALFYTYFCVMMFDQCLAAQHEFAMMEPSKHLLG